MIVHDAYKQGSPEWLMARASIPTASDLHRILTPEFKIRKGQMFQSYLAEKLAEKWLGGPLLGAGSWGMEQGSLLEREAIPFLSLDQGWEIERPAFITTDCGRIGCSPDGILPGFGGLEIKCPDAPQHIKYLLANSLPPEYAAQVHGGMYVTGLEAWYFVSYRRKMPALIVRVDNDPQIQAAIHEALSVFLDRFDKAWDKLLEINGGPPPKTEDIPYSAWQESLEAEADQYEGVTP